MAVMPQVNLGEGGNGSPNFVGSAVVLCNGDIFSSGSMVEEVTFQGKEDFKKSYHTLNTGHSRKNTAAKENKIQNASVKERGGMTPSFLVISTPGSRDLAEHTSKTVLWGNTLSNKYPKQKWTLLSRIQSQWWSYLWQAPIFNPPPSSTPSYTPTYFRYSFMVYCSKKTVNV